jgi:hypothetical protein
MRERRNMPIFGRGGPKVNVKVSITVIVEPDGNAYHAYAPAFKGLHVDVAD